MRLIRTIKIKLDVSENQIKPTIDAYTESYNFVCKTGFQKTTNGVKLHEFTYKEARKSLPSQLAISARMKATESLRSAKALKSKKCPQSKQCSIRLDANSYNVWLGTPNIISILAINGRKKFEFNVPEYFQQYLTWRRTSADLFICNGKVFINIVFEKEIEDVLPNGKLIGIDRGVKRPAVSSDNRFYDGKRLWHIKRKYQELRSQLQSKKHSGKRHLQKIKQKENRFVKDANHCLSKQIVSKLQSGDTIVLEKLTGIRGGARKLTKEQREQGKKTLRKPQRQQVNQWSFFQLEQFLTYKAAAKGIRVVYVDARYTSQRCSKCGHIKKSNRKNQSIFKCRLCGFQHNADLNAAKNICLKYLDATGYPSTAVVNQPNGANQCSLIK
jgi:IS605 OrfB family transposase